MTSMTTGRLTPVSTPQSSVTVAEAARRLGLDMEAVLELVYSHQLPAAFEAATGRIRLAGDEVERLRRERRVPRSR